MDVLKRELAPLVTEAWTEIEAEAGRVLKANLSARRFVDFEGPMGFECSSVNLGTLRPRSEELDGVHYGIRQVLPLLELRVPFDLSIWDLDNLARGAKNVSLDAVVTAAKALATFEERAIYRGLDKAGIVGLTQACGSSDLRLGEDASRYPEVVARALLQLSDAGVGGPCALVLGPSAFRVLAGDISTYPPQQRITKMLEGPVLYSPVLDGGFLVSLRGGDFQFTVGQDVSVGYDHHDASVVSLYLTESFTFRVLGPEAVVRLEA